MLRQKVRIGVLGLGAVGLALVLQASCGGGGGGGSSSGTTGGGGSGSLPPAYHVWVGKNGAMAFSPTNISVAPGSTVTWDFYGTHTVTSDAGVTPAFDSGTMSTGTFTQTFNTLGVYTYTCTIHGSMMSGTVTVQNGGTGGGSGY